nr:aspartate/glutamate racemase family protein [Streptomyces albicerus]
MTRTCYISGITDFEEIERNQREGRWDLVGDLLAREGNKLKAADADFFLLACSTVHTADQRVESAVDLPFIHIVDPTARQILRRGLTTVGLLGSRYTMTGSYFVDRLRQRYGLKVLVTEGEHQENVHNALYAELAKGVSCPPPGKSSGLPSRTWSSAVQRRSSSVVPSSACWSKPTAVRCPSSIRPSRMPRLP